MFPVYIQALINWLLSIAYHLQSFSQHVDLSRGKWESLMVIFPLANDSRSTYILDGIRGEASFVRPMLGHVILFHFKAICVSI